MLPQLVDRRANLVFVTIDGFVENAEPCQCGGASPEPCVLNLMYHKKAHVLMGSRPKGRDRARLQQHYCAAVDFFYGIA